MTIYHTIKGRRFFDGSFKDAGQVGVWTKANSVIWFDDLGFGPKR